MPFPMIPDEIQMPILVSVPLRLMEKHEQRSLGKYTVSTYKLTDEFQEWLSANMTHHMVMSTNSQSGTICVDGNDMGGRALLKLTWGI